MSATLLRPSAPVLFIPQKQAARPRTRRLRVVSAPLGATGVVRHDVPLNAGGINGAGGIKPVGPVGGATSG